ncbi:MAG: cupin domain-containing protein, partial [Acidimicrobiales bacterium]
MLHSKNYSKLAWVVSAMVGLSLGACTKADEPPGNAAVTSAVSTQKPVEAKLPALIVDGDEGEAIAFPLHPTRRLADPDTNIAGMSFFELKIAARSPGAPPHTHSHEDEFFYVREGNVTFLSGAETKTIGPGGLALLPRHGLHGFWNAGDADAILL